MNISNITKEEKNFLVHAIDCAVDKLSKDKEQPWVKDKNSFEKSITYFEEMKINIRNLKTID